MPKEKPPVDLAALLSAKPADTVAKSPELKALEEIFRIATAKIKETDPEFGKQVSVSASVRIALPDLALGEHASLKRSRKAGGRQRGAQQRLLADMAAVPIHARYKALLASGVPPRRAIAKTATDLQRTARYSRLDQRQVRRAVERLRKKDSS